MIRTTCLLAAMAGPAAAQSLSFPSNATQTAVEDQGPGTLDLPTEPWAYGGFATLPIDGAIRHEAWRIASPGLSSLQLLRPLREQLAAAGYDTVFECQTEACGGFDFRFAIPVLLPPQMQVDLGDFRYLAALRTEDGDARAVAILVSPTDAAGFVQITTVGGAPAATPSAPALRAQAPAEVGSLADALATTGRAVLGGLDFRTGSSQLDDGPVPALQDLADYLAANPDLRVALVGHTDAEGALDANIALSKRRAGAVLERLVSAYDVPRRQLAAEGNGYLSPIASNRTAEGREANRRVEVIVTSTE